MKINDIPPNIIKRIPFNHFMYEAKYCIVPIFALLMVLFVSSCGGGTGGPATSAYKMTNTGNKIYILSPQWGIVTGIDMNSLSLNTYSVGQGANLIMPAHNNVVVLNPTENAVYIIAGNTVIKKTVAANLNSMVVSSDGSHAVVYHNYIPGEEAYFNGILVLNTFSIVNLTTTTDDTVSLSIGSGAPQQVVFTPAGDKIIVISRNQCFVVPTETPFANHYIELWPNPSQVVVPDQVVVTPQGDMALVRSEAQNSVYVINLLTPSISNVLTENQPTQISMFPDGNMAMIMNAGSESIGVLGIDHNALTIYEQSVNISTQADTIATAFSCTGACSSSTAVYSALAYSPTSSATAITYLRVQNGIISATVFGDLSAPVNSIIFVPDSPSKALIIHNNPNSPASAYAMSLIDVDAQRVNPFFIQGAPSSILFAKQQDGDELVFMTLTLNNELVYYDLVSGATGRIELPASPDTLGLTGNTLFVLHDQPLGFITLIDINTFVQRYVNGFNVYKLFNR
ncbi:MAG: hypothetical protein M1381_09035 [Deltaproteobacteria bacterium]|nr:hypothetical protein [Deltaproteobacteria bacterium]MCL5792893.1 hypothetical protein [Deltaproteobacteria bacterium]